MLIFKLHTDTTIFFNNPQAVTVTRPDVTTNRELDTIIEELTAAHPDSTIMKIYYTDGLYTLHVADFDGYTLLYDEYYKAFELMRKAA